MRALGVAVALAPFVACIVGLEAWALSDHQGRVAAFFVFGAGAVFMTCAVIGLLLAGESDKALVGAAVSAAVCLPPIIISTAIEWHSRRAAP